MKGTMEMTTKEETRYTKWSIDTCVHQEEPLRGKELDKKKARIQEARETTMVNLDGMRDIV